MTIRNIKKRKDSRTSQVLSSILLKDTLYDPQQAHSLFAVSFTGVLVLLTTFGSLGLGGILVEVSVLGEKEHQTPIKRGDAEHIAQQPNTQARVLAHGDDKEFGNVELWEER